MNFKASKVVLERSFNRLLRSRRLLNWCALRSWKSAWSE